MLRRKLGPLVAALLIALGLLVALPALAGGPPTNTPPVIDGYIFTDTVWVDVAYTPTDYPTGTLLYDEYTTPDSEMGSNELYAIFITWDSDNLYLGLQHYTYSNNGVAVYFDLGTPTEGITTLNATDGYVGAWPRFVTFTDTKAIDFFVTALSNSDGSNFTHGAHVANGSLDSSEITCEAATHYHASSGYHSTEWACPWSAITTGGPFPQSLYVTALLVGSVDGDPTDPGSGAGDAMPYADISDISTEGTLSTCGVGFSNVQIGPNAVRVSRFDARETAPPFALPATAGALLALGILIRKRRR
jgi:hypothetical protein